MCILHLITLSSFPADTLTPSQPRAPLGSAWFPQRGCTCSQSRTSLDGSLSPFCPGCPARKCALVALGIVRRRLPSPLRQEAACRGIPGVREAANTLQYPRRPHTSGLVHECKALTQHSTGPETLEGATRCLSSRPHVPTFVPRVYGECISSTPLCHLHTHRGEFEHRLLRGACRAWGKTGTSLQRHVSLPASPDPAWSTSLVLKCRNNVKEGSLCLSFQLFVLLCVSKLQNM